MKAGRNWWAGASDGDLTSVPNFHVMKCVPLLKQCKRLRSLHLYQLIDLVGRMKLDVYMTNPLIEGIYSFRVIKKVEIRENYANGLPAHYDIAKWLKKVRENSRRAKSKDEKRVWVGLGTWRKRDL